MTRGITNDTNKSELDKEQTVLNIIGLFGSFAAIRAIRFSPYMEAKEK
jgi:hypothetical protein